MKTGYFLLAICYVLSSCTSSETQKKIETMQKRIDTLNAQMQKQKTDLGETMLGIQMHHQKLWFAGTAGNWPLAGYEVKEMQEAFELTQQIDNERPEVVNIKVIYPSLSTVKHAIEKKDMEAFKAGYSDLTRTCNNCHRMGEVTFNNIIVPTVPPVSDQEFKP